MPAAAPAAAAGGDPYSGITDLAGLQAALPHAVSRGQQALAALSARAEAVLRAQPWVSAMSPEFEERRMLVTLCAALRQLAAGKEILVKEQKRAVCCGLDHAQRDRSCGLCP